MQRTRKGRNGRIAMRHTTKTTNIRPSIPRMRKKRGESWSTNKAGTAVTIAKIVSPIQSSIFSTQSNRRFSRQLYGRVASAKSVEIDPKPSLAGSKSCGAARHPPSARKRDGPREPLFTWLAFRCFDGERDVCGPSFEPVLGVELGIGSEIEVSVAIRDWKEKPDLRPDPGDA